MTMRRAAMVPVLVLLAGTFAACGGQGPSSPPTTVTPQATATSSTSTTTTAGDDMRAQLATGLRPVSPGGARLVENAATKLRVVPASWLSGWQVIDVTNNTLAHPQRFYVALSESGEVQYLTGEPDSFTAVVTAARPTITSAQTARSVSDLYLDSTRDFAKYSYRIASLGDVVWLAHPTSDDTAARAKVEKNYRAQVTKPSPQRSGSGWKLTQWMVNGTHLVRHDITVAATGEVIDRFETVAALPVPDSV